MNWTASPDKFETIKAKMVEFDSELLGDVEKCIQYCKHIAAVALAYNTLFAQFPACPSAQARCQCVRDLMKQLAQKQKSGMPRGGDGPHSSCHAYDPRACAEESKEAMSSLC